MYEWHDSENDSWSHKVPEQSEGESYPVDKAHKIGEWVIERTKRDDELDIYETRDFIGMMNSCADFSWQMMYFIFALEYSGGI